VLLPVAGCYLHAVDRLRRTPVREFRVRGDVGRATDLILMADDQHPILRRYQIGLDEIGAVLDGDGVGGKGVLGTQRAGTAMADDEDLRGEGLGRCSMRGHRKRSEHHGESTRG